MARRPQECEFGDAQLALIKAELFKAMANPTRVQILELILAGRLSVSEMLIATEVAPSTLSTHLTALRRAGIVRGERQGGSVSYHLTDETAMADLLDAARRLLRSNAKRHGSVLARLDSQVNDRAAADGSAEGP